VFLARELGSGDIRGRLQAALTRPTAVVVAGGLGPLTVGVGVAHREELGDGSRLGRIDVLFVEPGGRGVGVGEAVMAGLLGWCASAGCAGVDATALPGNREAKNFFEAAGFSARLLVMHHRMPGADD